MNDFTHACSCACPWRRQIARVNHFKQAFNSISSNLFILFAPAKTIILAYFVIKCHSFDYKWH